jgi:hypothetical protein
MWEKDKQVLAAFRECMKAAIADMKAKEEVDFESTCNEERTTLLKYTLAMHS